MTELLSIRFPKHRYAHQGLTLRELIIQAQETGHWSVAGTPERLADAIEERVKSGVLDVLSLHGFGNPDQEDLLVNGLLPELRRRQLIYTDYCRRGFPLQSGAAAACVTDSHSRIANSLTALHQPRCIAQSAMQHWSAVAIHSQVGTITLTRHRGMPPDRRTSRQSLPSEKVIALNQLELPTVAFQASSP
jgi:hypothetical protein